MHFNLTDEQRALSDMVQRFLSQEYAFDARRKILRSPDGWSREIWGKLGEMGLLALQVPEAQGGMAPATVETLLTLGAMGRPRRRALPLLRRPRHRAGARARDPGPAGRAPPGHGHRRAHRRPGPRRGRLPPRPLPGLHLGPPRRGGFILTGRKAVVLHAPAADLLLVTARTSGAPDAEAGLSVFAVPAGSPGVKLIPYPTIDGQRAADVELAGVALPGDALLGQEGKAFPGLSAAFDLGVAALCAEAVGVLQATLDATTEYTRTRKQFGVPIARFQALQHRIADMLMHVEQARSMSYLAAMQAASTDVRERRRIVSAAKVTVGQACRYVGQQAVQLHGGMGVTDELMVSHCFKRLMAIELSLGDTEHHLERFITESK